MRVTRIYSPIEITAGEEIELDERAAVYIARVLRLKKGSVLHLFNGSGGVHQCEIVAIRRTQVRVLAHIFLSEGKESPVMIHLGQGLSRGERMDFVVQKATELGVASITPILTSRCEVRLEPARIKRRRSHWQQVAISACEQCGRNIIPVIEEPLSLAEWVACGKSGLNLVLHPSGDQKLSQYSNVTSVSLLVGPEGGLTEDEIFLVREENFQAISLGPRVLRTETAPVAAIAIAQHLWGDF